MLIVCVQTSYVPLVGWIVVCVGIGCVLLWKLKDPSPVRRALLHRKVCDDDRDGQLDGGKCFIHYHGSVVCPHVAYGCPCSVCTCTTPLQRLPLPSNAALRYAVQDWFDHTRAGQLFAWGLLAAIVGTRCSAQPYVMGVPTSWRCTRPYTVRSLTPRPRSPPSLRLVPVFRVLQAV